MAKAESSADCSEDPTTSFARHARHARLRSSGLVIS